MPERNRDSSPESNADVRLEAMKRDELAVWRWTHGALLGLLVIATLTLLGKEHRVPLLDGVNTLLHEGGHPLFGVFGRTMGALGGTLGQLSFPLAFALYFGWRRRETIPALVCGWWFFENFISIGIYMRDAIDRRLALIGGEVHDWEFLFRRWGVYSAATEAGATLIVLGVVGMIGCLGAIGYLLYRGPEWAP